MAHIGDRLSAQQKASGSSIKRRCSQSLLLMKWLRLQLCVVTAWQVHCKGKNQGSAKLQPESFLQGHDPHKAEGLLV